MLSVLKKFLRIEVHTLKPINGFAQAIKILLGDEDRVSIWQLVKILPSIQILHILHTGMVSGPVRICAFVLLLDLRKKYFFHPIIEKVDEYYDSEYFNESRANT